MRVARRGESGAGLVDSLFGVTMILLFLLLAAQTMIHLYATSSLSQAATRAAEDVAYSADPPAEVAAAQAEAIRELGSFGAHDVKFVWEQLGPQNVVLTVSARSPGLLPLPASWRDIHRTVVVRRERFR